DKRNIHVFLQKEIKKNHCEALCIGMSCPHDMKQLISKITDLQEQYVLPILTPLIGRAEDEIRKNAQKVGI
ncbi:MAG: hypothetical protein KGY65_08950, partial [Candidatus Thermoplasmatota archaeon]|nr:hypothetical protein [Candidatus Thermoplasmatota archaeon]